MFWSGVKWIIVCLGVSSYGGALFAKCVNKVGALFLLEKGGATGYVVYFV